MMTCFDLSYLVVGGGARVPDHELLVVGHGAKEGLVQQVPGNILNDGRVAGEDGLGVNHLVLLGRAVDVPEADGVVVGGGEEVPVQVGVPAQPVALLLVAAQPQVGVALQDKRRKRSFIGIGSGCKPGKVLLRHICIACIFEMK